MGTVELKRFALVFAGQAIFHAGNLSFSDQAWIAVVLSILWIATPILGYGTAIAYSPMARDAHGVTKVLCVSCLCILFSVFSTIAVIILGLFVDFPTPG